MRPVNLLPEGQRPRRPTGSASGGAYVVVGVLGALLVLVLVYVLVANGVTSRKEDIAEAQQQTERAKARAAVLAPYGDFAEVARTRTASVKTLASSRFDWERLVRELSLVLPEDAWLTAVEASVAPAPDATSAAKTTAPAGPSATLTGCAKDQPDVAELMVRLRKMHRVSEVTLAESGAAESPAGGGGSTAGTGSTTAGPPSSGSGGGAAQGCGSDYEFKLTVSFDPAPTAPAATNGGSARVSTRLGGGS